VSGEAHSLLLARVVRRAEGWCAKKYLVHTSCRIFYAGVNECKMSVQRGGWEVTKMQLDLEEFPRVVFARNPLKVVVAQVRFSPIYSLDQPAGVAAFQEAIRTDYPVAIARETEVAVAVGPGGISPPTGQAGPWRFQTEDEAWTVALAPDYVALETSNYERFEDFGERLARVLQVAAERVKPGRRERLGLRYVNEISHPNASTVADWKRFLASELLGLAGGELLKDSVTQSLQQVQVVLDEGNITIRHGYVRQGELESIYLLDIDVFDDLPGAFEATEMMARLGQFKEWVWRIFRRSITQELVDYLEPTMLERS
jgi:uncharacterized protein (TIGR04255 family)